MSDFGWFEESAETGACMRFSARSRRDGRLRLFIEHRAGQYARESHAIIADLPAADARRLLAWLRERYPQEDNENGD